MRQNQANHRRESTLTVGNVPDEMQLYFVYALDLLDSFCINAWINEWNKQCHVDAFETAGLNFQSTKCMRVSPSSTSLALYLHMDIFWPYILVKNFLMMWFRPIFVVNYTKWDALNVQKTSCKNVYSSIWIAFDEQFNSQPKATFVFSMHSNDTFQLTSSLPLFGELVRWRNANIVSQNWHSCVCYLPKITFRNIY